MKRIFIFLYTFYILCSFFISVDASEKIKVYIFTKDDEPICENAIDYFDKLKEEYDDYFVYEEFQVWDSNWKENAFNRELAENVAKKFNDEIIGAPYIVIGSNYRFDEYHEGLNDDIKEAIVSEYENDNYKDLVDNTVVELKEERSKEGVYTGAILIGGSAALLIVIVLARRTQKKKD